MHNRHLPNLHALRAFEAAARHESFQKAAEELGLTPSAVSRHLRALEADLGYPLFERLHRAVVLTEEGARYAAQVTAAFETLSLRPHTPARKRVVVDIDGDLLRQWLLPRLIPSVRESLDVDIQFRARSDRPRLLPGDTDLAIVWGALDYEGFTSRILLKPRVFAVAAPSFGLDRLSDMAGQTLLHDRNETWWRRLFEAADLPYPASTPTLTFDRCDLPIEAARLELGVAVGDDVIAEPDLKSGALTRLAGPVLESRNFHLLTRRRITAAVCHIADWIMEEAESFRRRQNAP
ncbi:MAG: LysR family transcriptional regulator [Pseudomonadota bacterium]